MKKESRQIEPVTLYTTVALPLSEHGAAAWEGGGV